MNAGRVVATVLGPVLITVNVHSTRAENSTTFRLEKEKALASM
jgi:hypothetical protein